MCVCLHQYSNVLCLYDLYLYLCIWRPSKECKLQHEAALATHSFGHFGFLCLHWDTLEHLGIWRLHSAQAGSVQNQKLCAHEMRKSRFKHQLAFPNFVVAKLVSTWNLYPLKLVTTGTPVSSHLQLDFPAFGQNLRCNLSKLPFEFLLRLIYQVCWIYHLRS